MRQNYLASTYRYVSKQAFPSDAPRESRVHPQTASLDEMFNNPNLKERTVPIQLRQSGDGPNGAVDEAGMAGSG